MTSSTTAALLPGLPLVLGLEEKKPRLIPAASDDLDGGAHVGGQEESLRTSGRGLWLCWGLPGLVANDNGCFSLLVFHIALEGLDLVSQPIERRDLLVL